MKKIIIIFLFITLSMQLNYANDNSYHNFLINIKDIPNNDDKIHPKKDNSLSDGAITAITLGSIFGGIALGGAGYYFYKKGVKLIGYEIKNKLCALYPLCYDDKLHKDKKYYQLQRLKDNENLDKTCKKKYIFIEDTFIKRNSYNRYYFKVDQNYKNLKIIQYSKPYLIGKNIPELNTKIFNENLEINTYTNKINKDNGVLIKTSKYNFKKDTYYFIDISLVSKQLNNIYALALEFE